jgi:hypothetical protein
LSTPILAARFTLLPTLEVAITTLDRLKSRALRPQLVRGRGSKRIKHRKGVATSKFDFCSSIWTGRRGSKRREHRNGVATFKFDFCYSVWVWVFGFGSECILD